MGLFCIRHSMNELQQNKLLNLFSQGITACTDSRKAGPGKVFFALRGDHFNGNVFAPKAIESGCPLAVVDDPPPNPNDNFLIVEDVLECLQQVGKAHRQRMNYPFVAITGSNGKTTTKELTHAVLSSVFSTQSTLGNLNNHIGVPATLLNMKPGQDMAIVEMGANHLEEIAALCRLALPTHGLITNIGKAHLEGFGSLDNIYKAKTELFEDVASRKGTLFINTDDPFLQAHANTENAVCFGAGPTNHCSGKIIGTNPFLTIQYETRRPFGKCSAGIHAQIVSKLSGDYNFGNLMAAITVGLYFGVNPQHVANAISSYTPKNHRSQLEDTGRNRVFLDAYNANPTSMAAAISHFSKIAGEAPSFFLGDMLELGDYAREEHSRIDIMTANLPHRIRIFVGRHFSEVVREDDKTKVFQNVQQASQWLQEHPISDHFVLLKGSRGIGMENLLPLL